MSVLLFDSRSSAEVGLYTNKLDIVCAGCMGYDVNTVPLIQSVHGKQQEVPTLPKKKKESNLGSDAVSVPLADVPFRSGIESL